MFNENQKKYTVKEVKRYREEANSADRRAFWDMIGVYGSIVLIGVSSVIAKEVLPEYVDALSTGLKVLGGIAGTTFLTQAIANHSERNVKEGNADLLETGLTQDNLDDVVTGRHIKK